MKIPYRYIMPFKKLLLITLGLNKGKVLRKLLPKPRDA
jgi:hypothetical protein